MSKDELATVDKCESVVPMTKADQVTKTCADFNGNKDKYSEVFIHISLFILLFTKIEDISSI